MRLYAGKRELTESIGGNNMPLTPLDIHNKEFARGFRGFVEDEVNEFLDQVIKDYEFIIREKRELEQQLKTANSRLDHYMKIEDTLKQSIIIAQEAAEEVKKNANQEAKLIVNEAEKNADRIVQESIAKSRQVMMDMEELKKQVMIYKSRFRMLVESQLELIEGGELEQQLKMDDLPTPKNSYDFKSSIPNIGKFEPSFEPTNEVYEESSEPAVNTYVSDETVEMPFVPFNSDQVSGLREKVAAATLDKKKEDF